ncbi:phosphatase PAP2 family protein [Candidatus Daviesbacteria bacterium]|nr:phosphatase PAP2 family protein [Candidatus Daviesbacteria bacterium]
MDNVSLFFQIYNLNGQNANIDKLMVFVTDYLIHLLFILSFIVSWKGKILDRKAFLIMLISFPIAVILIKIIHIFIYEPRPWVTFNLIPLADNHFDASFPSRHATLSAVIAFSYLYFGSKWAAPFLIAMLLIGFSRIYVGVHYPLDILGGFVVAGLAIFIAVRIKNLIFSQIFRHS